MSKLSFELGHLFFFLWSFPWGHPSLCKVPRVGRESHEQIVYSLVRRFGTFTPEWRHPVKILEGWGRIALAELKGIWSSSEPSSISFDPGCCHPALLQASLSTLLSEALSPLHSLQSDSEGSKKNAVLGNPAEYRDGKGRGIILMYMS